MTNSTLVRPFLLLISTTLLSTCSTPPSQIAVAPTVGVDTPVAEVTPTAMAKQTDKEVLVEGRPSDIAITKRHVEQQVNIEFILDASGSMLELMGNKSRLQTAKDVLSEMVKGLPPKVAAGLRVYGHRYAEKQQEQSCQDVELLQGLDSKDRDGFLAKLGGIQAKGWTPLAKSIQTAAADMPAGENISNNVILISDGEETCGGDPVSVARKAKKSPANVTVHAISFAGNDTAKEQLQQIAQESGGIYREAEDAVSLLQALESAVATNRGAFVRVEVTGESARQVTASVILRNPGAGQNVHQFNSWIDAPVSEGTFDIIVATAPRTIFRSQRLDKDTFVLIKLATGALRVELSDSDNKPVSSPVELRDPKTGTLLRNFPTWYNQSALAGSYDLFLTMPSRIRRRVQVETGKLSVVSVGTGILRIELTAMGGNRLRALVELHDPETHEVLRTISTWSDQQVVTGAYDLEIENVLGAARNQLTMETGERKTLSLASGMLRVETNEKSQKPVVDVSLLDAKSRKTLGEFKSWEDKDVLTGDYLLLIKTEPQVLQPVTVEANKQAVIKLR